MPIKTLRFRIKDKHCAELNRQARAVNLVWNYVNELSERSIKERGKWLSAYDLQKYTDGVSKLLGLHSHTVQEVCREYAAKRDAARKRRLKWRKSGGSRRSLGWVPFKSGAVKVRNGLPNFRRTAFKIWDSYGIADYKLKAGSFSEDADGRWYLNVVVEVKAEASQGKGSIGVDPGCKDAATDSDGRKIASGWYRKIEPALRIAQRAGNNKRVNALHRKAKNCRKDALHKETTRMVRENAAIFFGNANSKNLAKTRLAKGVLDASWGMMKTMLEYKCAYAGVVFMVVNEAGTSQTCSSCGSKDAPGRPRGIAGLGIREWACSCGAVHDRDINAARNILALGHGRLAGGISVL